MCLRRTTAEMPHQAASNFIVYSLSFLLLCSDPDATWPRGFVCLSVSQPHTHTQSLMFWYTSYLKLFAGAGVGLMSRLQHFTFFADLLMTPAGCGPSICCRVHQIPFFIFILARHRSGELEVCQLRHDRKAAGNWGTEIKRWKWRKNWDGRPWMGGARPEMWNIKVSWVSSSASLQLLPLCFTHTHTLLHCRWTQKPDRKRHTRKTELASDYGCSISTKTSKCEHARVTFYFFFINLIYYWALRGVISARPPHRLSSARHCLPRGFDVLVLY